LLATKINFPSSIANQQLKIWERIYSLVAGLKSTESLELTIVVQLAKCCLSRHEQGGMDLGRRLSVSVCSYTERKHKLILATFDLGPQGNLGVLEMTALSLRVLVSRAKFIL
jgi:hypothetical protein